MFIDLSEFFFKELICATEKTYFSRNRKMNWLMTENEGKKYNKSK